MSTKKDKIDSLNSFKSRIKFSSESWEQRGLNPSSVELCQKMEFLFNSICDEIVDSLQTDIADKQLKELLKDGLKRFKRKDYDTEEAEFICDLFLELGIIVEIDIKSDLNKWLYGSLFNSILKFSKIIKIESPKETIQQPCTKCGIQLESYIVKKEAGIPDTSWLIIKCNNCGELNLLSIGPDVKEFKFGNYQWVEALNKEEYNNEQALVRLEQIKVFRKY